MDAEIKIMDAAGLESTVAFMGVGEGPTYRASAFDDGYKIYSIIRSASTCIPVST